MKKIVAAVIGFSILFFTYQFSINNRGCKIKDTVYSTATAYPLDTLLIKAKPGIKTDTDYQRHDTVRDMTESGSEDPAKYVFLSAPQFDFEKSIYTPILKPVFIFLIMIAGMIANQAYTLIQAEKKNTVSIRNVWAQTFQGKKFWTAIMVSPLIFAYFFSSIDGMTKELPCYLLGFQNGFFWHTVFSKSEKHETKTSDKTDDNEVSRPSPLTE